MHKILAAAAPENPADDRVWDRLGELLPHVTSEATEMTQSRDPDVREFALNVMRYLYLSGDHASCREFTERFIGQWTADSGQDDRFVLAAQRHYGNVLRELGSYEDSYRLNEGTLTRARTVLGDEDEVTLQILTSFAADQRAR